MNLFRRLVFWLALLPASVSAASAPTKSAPPPPLVLISFDGFRWDYCERYPDETPNLQRFQREGVSARGLIPVFPSNTFPNHYSIVTGLYPTSHGIVNNGMFDAATGETFLSNRRACVQDSRWWGGEPIWVTAARHGQKSGCLFWIGSEAPIQGVRPTRWRAFDASTPFADRLADLLAWFELPPGECPQVVTFYLEEANSAGHRFGPNAPELAATLRILDAQLGQIRRELEQRGIVANYVLVADHGMTECGPERVVFLDDYVDLATVQVDFEQSVVGLRPQPGSDVAAILRALEKLPASAKIYRAEALPRHLHIDPRNPRVPPIWILPDEGWHVLRRASYDKGHATFPKGQHGYDPALESMHGILIAVGPSFRTGGDVIDRVENIHVYNLLCAALGWQPAPNEGDDRLVRAFLR